MMQRIQYAVAWAFVKMLGVLPRAVARGVSAWTVRLLLLLLPSYTRENIEDVLVLDGHENFLAGKSRGKGVIYLTGHIGAWELSSYAHALYGFPLHYMARPL